MLCIVIRFGLILVAYVLIIAISQVRKLRLREVTYVHSKKVARLESKRPGPAMA